jgi:hypothetical protein
MSTYDVKLFKDGELVGEWRVATAAGADPDEEEITWTEQDSDEMFEQRVVSAVAVPGWPVSSGCDCVQIV